MTTFAIIQMVLNILEPALAAAGRTPTTCRRYPCCGCRSKAGTFLSKWHYSLSKCHYADGCYFVWPSGSSKARRNSSHQRNGIY